MLDTDGYPDEESLEQIAHWDILKKPIEGLLSLIEENTLWADRQIRRWGKNVIHYHYSTGGWSGNEDVIEALHKNTLFWALFWRHHFAGGHYYFKIKVNRKTGCGR